MQRARILYFLRWRKECRGSHQKTPGSSCLWVRNNQTCIQCHTRETFPLAMRGRRQQKMVLLRNKTLYLKWKIFSCHSNSEACENLKRPKQSWSLHEQTTWPRHYLTYLEITLTISDLNIYVKCWRLTSHLSKWTRRRWDTLEKGWYHYFPLVFCDHLVCLTNAIQY